MDPTSQETVRWEFPLCAVLDRAARTHGARATLPLLMRKPVVDAVCMEIVITPKHLDHLALGKGVHAHGALVCILEDAFASWRTDRARIPVGVGVGSRSSRCRRRSRSRHSSRSSSHSGGGCASLSPRERYGPWLRWQRAERSDELAFDGLEALPLARIRAFGVRLVNERAEALFDGKGQSILLVGWLQLLDPL